MRVFSVVFLTAIPATSSSLSIEQATQIGTESQWQSPSLLTEVGTELEDDFSGSMISLAEKYDEPEPITNLAQTQVQAQAQAQFILGAILNMLGNGGGYKKTVKPFVQNAPGVNIINNSRNTSLWVRKAWKEQHALRIAKKAAEDAIK